jgi:cardiolipin synthase
MRNRQTPNNDFSFGLSALYKHIPNGLTILRLLCTPLIIWAIATNHLTTAFWIFFAIGATDYFDGYLARRWKVTSRLGQILDPIADKVLLISIYLSLGLWGFIPLWLTIFVLIRDFLILAVGGTMILAHKGNMQLPPQMMGKISTTLQMLFVGLILAGGITVSSIPTSSIQSILMVLFLYVVALTTILSGITYANVVVKLFTSPK